MAMKVWAVMVKPEMATGRYLDSLWIQESSADDRIGQLKEALVSGWLEGSRVWKFQIQLEDGAIYKKREKHEP